LRPVVLHAPSSRRRKGTEHVIAACEGLEVELDIVEGLRHDEARRHYERADIVVDQLNAGWYGIFAVEAMALGKPVLSYLHDEAAEETEHALGVEIPIVRITKETLRERIAELAGSADERLRIGASSRSYVERVHDADRGADRLIGIYTSLF
jgi:glycosyltransferase involved in cell wall biosynthesis